MASLFWLLVFIGGGIAMAYRRVGLSAATAATGAALMAYTVFGDGGALWLLILWAGFGLMAALNLDELRVSRVTAPLLKMYRKMLPNISDTERQALEAGTVWWEGEIFSGSPRWQQLRNHPAPQLSEEEQAFLDGPTEQLCLMLDEWTICHELADLPESVWTFIKENRFFAMIIPKAYGGLEFSAFAHSQILAKISSRSATAASMVAVPNSLGPAELLLHYGTDAQKQRYLPGLASGKEIPCFGLTAPRAGSDAASISDSGVVCKGEYKGKEVLGLRLNFDKRYITLAPVATVVGLAFRLYDPDGLLGDDTRKDYGITVGLIPSDTPGVEIGRRHLPIGIPFMNGPIKGKDVFVPLDAVVGGPQMAGHGWRMLVELLSVGRSISLPANAVGGAKAGTFATGAYARIRKQFNTSIGNFEGVQEALARMAGFTYIADAARSVTLSAIDNGAKPSVPSAILKYHCTEMSRAVANDAMDVQGGKAIMMGPKNYLGTGYTSVPVMITVEGANILTRSLIIFGQGAIRCHPFVLRELEAARDPDEDAGLLAFDKALFGHFGYALSNAARSLIQAVTLARYADVPVEHKTRRYYQHITRFSASFALATDVAMLTLGGALKKKEMLSARLGDVLSTLYLASTVLKHYENAGRPEADLPLVEWSCRHLLYKAQEQLHSFLRNFPNRWIAAALRVLIFPRGRTYFAPSDLLSRRVVELIINPTVSRDRLCAPVYRTAEPTCHLGVLQETMEISIAVAPLEKKLRHAVRDGRITAPDLPGRISEAVKAEVLTAEEASQLLEADRKIMEVISVDDFDSSELVRQPGKKAPRKAAARSRSVARKTVATTPPEPPRKEPRPGGKEVATGG